MPPLVVTKPLTAAAVSVKDGKQRGINFDNDGWLEKVSAVREQHAEPTAPHPPTCSIIQRTLINLSFSGAHRHHRRKAKKTDEPHSYRSELKKCIAESNANLRDEEPQSSSDEESSDQDTDEGMNCPRNAEIFDFTESIVSLDSVMTDEYVVPPVEVPRSYRKQDRHGGVLVAGNFVTFTNWAFKRQLRHLGRLDPVPERGEVELPPVMNKDEVSEGVFSGKVVEL